MKTTLVLILALTIILAHPGLTQAAQPVPGEEAALVARIYADGSDRLASSAGDLDIWEVHPEGGYVVASLTSAQRSRLVLQGLRVEPDASLTALLAAPLRPAQVSGGIPGFPCYRTVEETSTALDQLAASYPALAQVVDAGDSWEKATAGGEPGYDLRMLRLTSPGGGSKPKFLLLAEVHARELATAETAVRFAELLLNHYGSDPEITWLLDYYEVDILPMVNPDGRKKAETGLYWRKNTHQYPICTSQDWGADLNRNSSFHWGGSGSSGFYCDETFRGEAPASEPETQAVQTLLASLFTDRRSAESDPAPLDTEGLLISLHSFGGLVLWPYGWTSTPAPNQVQLEVLGRKLAFYNHYTPQQAYALYPTSGITDDWAYGELGLPAFTIEMGSAFFESCANYEASIWPANRNALLYALKTARRPYQDPAGPEIVGAQLNLPVIGTGGSPLLTAQADDTRIAPGGSEPRQAIQAARYSIDSPSWVSGSVLTALNPQDGTFDTPVEMVNGVADTAGLAVGKHTLFIEAQDASGVWGVPSAVFLTILPSYAVQLSPTAQTLYALPGSWAEVMLTIQNTGIEPDAYNLQAETDPGWETTLIPDHTPTLASGEIITVQFRVRVPAGALGGSSAATQITITSISHAQTTSGGILTTTVSHAAWLPAVHK